MEPPALSVSSLNRHILASILWLLLVWFLPHPAIAQTYYDFGFTRRADIPVFTSADTLPAPWVGGINGVRFSEMDLDLDGTPDLVAFEKHGNRILPFLQENGRYQFAPQYIHRFPKLHDWAIFQDYNQDGKADIFTYGLAGIAVYKNISQDSLAFELVTEQLTAYYYNGYVNLFASPDDYPVIGDIDGDGHLDILNFWVLGKYVHHLRNHSSNPELFDFRLESECWGHFAEAADNNTISLFTDCDDKQGDGPTRHVGSTMLLHDLDGNGLPDLLVGDIDSPHLILLSNHGTATEARMTEQDTAFPAGAPVTLYSMPAPAAVSLPGQATPSLLVSPADPSLTKSQDHHSVWRYDYDSLLQQYALVQTDFLQGEMLDVGSGCRPVLYDWDQDGLLDLFLANYGSFDSAQTVNGFLTSSFSSSIQYYNNVGTADRPAFQLRDDDFGSLKGRNLQALHPTFGDITGDGQSDMLCGQRDGTLLLVSHSRLTTPTTATSNAGITEHYQNIDAGDFSAPQLFDLDGNGRLDLVIGNRRGLLSYYRDESTSGAPQFVHVTDTLGGVDVRNFELSYFGHNVPCLFRDPQRGTVLLCGSEQGSIFYYNHIDNNLEGTFTLAEHNLAEEVEGKAIPFREGTRTGVAVADLNGDGLPDMLVGNYAGGCAYFEGSTPLPHGIAERLPDIDIRLYPNPTTGVVHIRTDGPDIHRITLYNIHGQRLSVQVPNTPSCTINLTAQPAGLYIIQVETEKGTATKRIAITR